MRTDVSAINAKTISINEVPIAGSATPTSGLYTTFDQLDADMTLYLNGALIQGAPYVGQVTTNYDNLNLLSGLGLADVVKYGAYSTPASNAATGPDRPIGGSGIPINALRFIDNTPLQFSDGQYLELAA